MSIYRTLLVSCFLAQSATLAQVGAVRDWTSADGRVITAKLEQVTSDSVIVNRDGKRVSIPLKMLSEGDQEFAASVVEKQATDEVRSQGFREGKYADAVGEGWVQS